MFISFVRTIILYFTIILAVRVMGKRQINQLQTSELVVTLLISDLAVIPMQDSGQPLFSGLIPILVLIALEVLVSVFMLKSSRFHRLVCGKPVVIIKDGRIIQENMRQIVKGRTVLIVAHRLSSVRQCDRIITIEKGRIVEDGTHDELSKSGGRYASLLKLQGG